MRAISRWSVVALLGALTPVTAHASYDEIFRSFLLEGMQVKDMSKADDNATGEVLSRSLIAQMVKEYQAAPNSTDGQKALGLLALGVGVAEWGTEPKGLPNDPARKDWRSDSAALSGKHLMSYSVGGVGIMHADSGLLQDFIVMVATSGIVPQAHRDAYLKLKPFRFDQIRDAGLCKGQTDTTGGDSLDGEKFNVHPEAYKSSCTHPSSLVPADWNVFRTWTRAALRTIQVQRWLIDKWMEKDWAPSLAKTKPGEGKIEEALINVRVRNSSPALADKTADSAPTSKGLAARLQHELNAYGAGGNEDRLRRRCGIMQRPVVLYRALIGQIEPLSLDCPK